MQVIYEDNHIIIVSKRSGEIVQGDKTGDRTLADDVKQYIKEKYAKPGNVFSVLSTGSTAPFGDLSCLPRRRRPLSRLNDMFRTGDVHKTYWAIPKTALQSLKLY